jgi:hypothetical protein
MVVLQLENTLDFVLMPMFIQTHDGGITFALYGSDVSFQVRLDGDGLYQGTLASPEIEALEKSVPARFEAVCTWLAYVMHAIYFLNWKKYREREGAADIEKAARFSGRTRSRFQH